MLDTSPMVMAASTARRKRQSPMGSSSERRSHIMADLLLFDRACIA
jgi:hypothetical protein